MAHVERTVFANPRTITPSGDSAGLEILAGGRQIGEIEMIGRRIKRLLLEGDKLPSPPAPLPSGWVQQAGEGSKMPAPLPKNEGSTRPLPTPRSLLPAPRSSPPTDAAQEEAGRLMDEIYKVSAAKTPEQKLALASQLFKVATSQKVKPEERFVLLRKTTDLAADAGDVSLVLSATRRAGEEFDFDFLASQEKALARIALGPMEAARVEALLTGVSQGVDQALAAGRGELAQEFAGLARQVSQRKEGSEFRPLAARLQAEIAKATAQRQEISDARAALATGPDDAEANRTLGAYLCLEEGDWEHGLACLAKGGDGQIRTLAGEDAASPPSQAAEQAERGDEWWEAAQEQQGANRDLSMRRARYWYEKARGGLEEGLAKALVESRLGELAKAGGGK
jgi:hypothetical protein